MNVKRLFAAAVVALVASAGLAVAQGDTPLASEKAFPAGAFITVVLPDTTATAARFRRTAAYDLFQDPEMQALFAPIVREWRANWGPLASMSPVKPGALADLLSGEVGVCMVGRSRRNRMEGAFHVLLRPANPEAGARAWRALLGFATQTGALRPEPGKQGGTAIYRLPGRAELCVTASASVYLLTGGQARVARRFHEAAVRRLKSGDGSLADCPRFRKVMGKVKRPTAAYLYVDPTIILQAPDLPPDARGVLAGLGLANVGPALAGVSFRDRGVWITGYLNAPAPRRGIMALAGGAPLGPGDLAVIPPDASAFATGRMDLDGMYKGVMNIARSFMGPAFAQVEQAVQGVGAKLGVPVPELFAMFGDRFAVYRVGEGEPTVVLKVRDDRRAASNLTKLIAGVGRWIAEEAKVQPSEWVRPDVVKRGDFTQVCPNSCLPGMLTPNFIVGRGWMRFGLSARRTLADMRHRLATKGDIRDNRRFTDLLAKMPRGFRSVAYCDVPVYAGNCLEWFQFLGDIGHVAAKVALQNNELPVPIRLTEPQWLDPARFPSQELLRKKLFGEVCVWIVDKDGLRFEHFSPLGPMPACSRPRLFGNANLAQVGIMAGMLLPALARARGEARKASGKSNLKQIGVACISYAGDHGDRWPDSLSTLVPQYVQDPRLFLSPNDNPARAPNIAKGIKTSYCYVGNVPPRDLTPGTMMAYTRKGVHRDGRNVLFYDCHVQWQPERRFQRELRQQAREIFLPLLKKNPKGINPARIRAFVADRFYREIPAGRVFP